MARTTIAELTDTIADRDAEIKALEKYQRDDAARIKHLEEMHVAFKDELMSKERECARMQGYLDRVLEDDDIRGDVRVEPVEMRRTSLRAGPGGEASSTRVHADYQHPGFIQGAGYSRNSDRDSTPWWLT